MDSVKERLKKVALAVGVKTATKLSEETGIPYNTFGTWGKKNSISGDGILDILGKYPQVSETYLRTGEGDILKLDTGISNYGHDARVQEMCSAIEQISNEDKELVYNLLMRLKNESDDLEDALDKAFKQ